MGICSVLHLWAVLYSIFALFWGGPTLCVAQSCVSHPMPNMVIDIEPAVSHGVRGVDPIHTSTMEECSAACCSEHTIAGNRDCNLYIYDTRKMRAHPNCYLFNCPTSESCKMTPAEGVMSYSLWPESSSVKSSLYSSDKRQKQGPISSKQSHAGKADPESSVSKVSGSELRSQDKGSGSAVRAPGSVGHSQSYAGKEPGSTLRSQSSAPSEPDSVVNLQDSARKGSSSDADFSRKVSSLQSSSGIKFGSADKELLGKDLVQQQGAQGQKSPEPGSLDKDPAEEQGRITAEMLRLTENIEKHLDKMIQEPAPNSDNSLKTQAEPTVGTSVTTTQYRGLHRGDKGLELKHDDKIHPPTAYHLQSTLHTTRAPGAWPGTTSQKLKAITAAFQPVPGTKGNPISNMPSSLSKGIENAIGRVGNRFHPPVPSPHPKDVLGHPKTSTSFQGLHNGPPARAPKPVTPHSPLITLIAKTTRTSIKPTAVTLKAPGSSTLMPMAEVKRPVDYPIQLDTSGPKQDKDSLSDNINGLVAALVFGVLFLMVVIGLIGRKVSEAYRRHRYTKLDYLINGMYVDT